MERKSKKSLTKQWTKTIVSYLPSNAMIMPKTICTKWLFAGMFDSYEVLSYRPDTALIFVGVIDGDVWKWSATESRSIIFMDICGKKEECFAVNRMM